VAEPDRRHRLHPQRVPGLGRPRRFGRREPVRALPVANRNEGAIERAAAEAEASREEVRRLRLAIPREVRTAVDEYERARARLARFDNEFSRQAETARRAAEVSYRNGAVSPLDFLEAERAFIATQRDRLDALEDAHTAAYEIAQVAGRKDLP
jgi:cobalt-zinc-cadmium efflux system outer membrane protein